MMRVAVCFKGSACCLLDPRHIRSGTGSKKTSSVLHPLCSSWRWKMILQNTRETICSLEKNRFAPSFRPFTGSHITLQPKTGCPLKLSRVEPGQYLDGRPPEKTRLLLEEVLVRPAGGAHPVVCMGPKHSSLVVGDYCQQAPSFGWG